jgi:hypothetical protein
MSEQLPRHHRPNQDHRRRERAISYRCRSPPPGERAAHRFLEFVAANIHDPALRPEAETSLDEVKELGV